MPNEIELKLRIAAADVPRLRRHGALKSQLVGKPITRKLTSIYYDTPDLELLDAAISLRVRRMSGNWFQAVKGAGHSLAGLHQRMEWEDIIARGQPDFSKITAPSLAAIFDAQSLRDALKPIFITEVNRAEWQLQYQDGSAIEVALDLGKLKVGKQEEDISEIELELKHGKPRHLFELALALQADIPLHIENVSKAQRGYAHYRATQLSTSKAKPIVLSSKVKVAAAFQMIGWECLRQLQANQDMVLHGNDCEGVHQMRIAMRRLRVALKLFKREHEDIKAELDWLGSLLGIARDWDVLLQETLPAADSHANGKLHILEEAIKKARQRAYSKLKTAMNSQRYQKLLLTLGALLENDDKPAHKKLLPFAHGHLQKGFEKLNTYTKLSDLDTEQRHKTRIAVKNLHYTADFFASLNQTKKRVRKQQSFLQKLNQVQKLLGIMNDAATTEKLLQLLTHKQSVADIHEAANILLKWNVERSAATHQSLDSNWHSLIQAKPYWS
ncbi:MAG TPA: CYTH and CHAD domain-containing protein [Methylophilaceae bacterium]|jgi:inorganic triphosphatase YgiF